MDELKTFSGKEICRLLNKHGFLKIRQSSSHIVMQKKIKAGTITIVVPDHKEIKIGTLYSIIRQSKLSKK